MTTHLEKLGLQISSVLTVEERVLSVKVPRVEGRRYTLLLFWNVYDSALSFGTVTSVAECYLLICLKTAGSVIDSVDTSYTSHFAAYDLGLYYLFRY